jgi:hypothetical protein
MQCEKCKYELIHKNPEVSRLDELKCLSAQKMALCNRSAANFEPLWKIVEQ